MKLPKLPKLNISKRTAIIASSLIIAVAMPVGYLLWQNTQQEAEAWFNSSWLYRKSISVANAGSELTNEDVLVVVDTAALVTAGKLQSNCNDLRFVDSDDTTALSYWVEGGCNTTTTHVWVRIPTLPNGGKTIYMYYGNGSATNAEQTWTGKFYLMKTAACDTGWTTESNSGGDFFENFPKAASTFGTKSGLNSHTHTDSTFTTSGESAITNVRSQNQTQIADNHTHDITLATLSASLLPSYLDMIFCSNTKLVVKQNQVTPFDATVPTGFTRFSALDSAFPRGNSAYSGTQAGSTTHTHTVSAATTGTPSAASFCSNGTTVSMPTTTHTHGTSSFTSGSGTHLPEYTTMIYGQADADIMAPASTIVMSSATPPLGWTRFSAIDGKYPYGSSTYGTTGGTATHTHSASVTTGTGATTTCATGSPNHDKPSDTHTHSVSGNLNTHTNDPAYVETVFIKKNTSQSASLGTEETPGTAPDAPSSLLTEGATNPTGVTDLTPEFSAIFTDTDTPDTGVYYHIEVNTNNTFTGTVMWDSTKTAIGPITNGARSPDISYNGTTLTRNGTTYYWRMKFWDSSGLESVWSATAQFTMYTNVAPNAPSSLLAAGQTNPLKVTTTTPTFSAIFSDPDTPDTGVNYELHVNTNNTFTGTVMWESTKTAIGPITNGARSPNITYGLANLSLDGTTYYWRIRFWDDSDAVSNWSSTAQFTMSGVPYAPTSLLTEGQTNPTNVTDLTPEFSAIHTDPNQDSTTHYQIEVNTQADFLGTSMWDSTQTTLTVAHNVRSANIPYNGTTLSLNGATYYWRIRFWDSLTDVGPWSATAQFTMSTNTPPNAPSSLLAAGATNPIKVTTTTPTFSAIFSDPDTPDTGVNYELHVNTNNTFTGTVMWESTKTAIGPITNGARSPNITYSPSNLTLDGTTYYWRIRFWDNYDAVSTWSATAQFTMSGVPYAPTSLLTEGLTNPTAVTDLTPEFSAIHTDPNQDSTTHYQIEVNTQADFLGTSMWDSTQTTLTVAHNVRSANIPYNGTTLSLNGSTYYWRIRFWDSLTDVGPWSATAQFTMYLNIAPDAPSSLLTQGSTNPLKVTTTTPYFSAVFTDDNLANTGDFYEIEVNTNNTFTGTVMWDSNKTAITSITNGARSSNITYSPTNLALDGTTYYWRIRFWDNYDAVSTWSTTAQFTMSGVPYAPTSLLTEGQTNPINVTDLTPEFSAIHTDPNQDSTTHYQIQVNTNNTFTGTVMWDSTQTAITVAHNVRSANIPYNGTTLSRNGATYYWRIRFWDSITDVSDWSATAQFTMYTNVAPNAPSSLLAAGATNPIKVTTTTPTFSAIFSDPDASDTGVNYELHVNTNNTFTGTVMWESTKTAIGPITNGARSPNITYSPSNLTLDGTTYYWRIRFWDDSDAVSNWSSTAQFTMSGVPYAPTSLLTEGLTNPTGVTDLTPEFSAIHTDPNQDSTTHYQIEVNTQADFLGTSMWDSTQTAITVAHNVRSANIPYNGTTLSLNGSTYYWRIRFWDSLTDVGPWSATAQFTMYNNTAPSAPSSLLAAGATNPIKVTTTTPTFSAIFSDPNASDTGQYYEIEVNTNNTFTGTVMWDSNKTAISSITNGTRSSNITYSPSNLTLDGTTYYWRIRFWDNYDAVSTWSSTAQFTMSGVPYAPTSLLTEGLTNPTEVTDLTPEFSAIHTDPNQDSTTHYQIQVNTQSDFLGTSMWDSTQTTLTVAHNVRSADISYNGTTLTLDGSTYYWRIRFWDSLTDVSDWSATAQFTMYTTYPPNAPSSLLTQGSTNPLKVTTTTPYFSAIFSDPNAADTGDFYEIEVNTNNTFTGTVMWDTGKTAVTSITNGARSPNITYSPINLALDGTTYYWRMKFWDSSNLESTWSSTAQFTMSGVPYAPTSLLTEGATNPTNVTDLTPEFSAIHTDPNQDSTTHYQIQVNTNNTFTGTVMWDSTQTAITVAHNVRSADISYNGTTLTRNGATYYWRIRFWDSLTDVGTWSATAQFTMYTNVAPNAPSSLLAAGQTNPLKVTTTTPTFSAIFSDPDATDTGVNYELHVNTNNTFTGTVMWESTKTSITAITNGTRSSNITYSPANLSLNGTTYYWRIRFWDDGDLVSNWSATAQFTMSGAPYAPTSLLTEGATNPTSVTDLTPEFSAIHTDPNQDSTAHYEINVNTQANFGGTVMWNSGKTAITVIHNARSANIPYNGTALSYNGNTYYWRIRFWDTDDNTGTWSSTAQFTMYTNFAPNAPTSLLAEGVTNPLKVLDLTPELSAVFTDSNAGDTGEYYEIHVNTASDFTGTSMWQSTKTAVLSITNGARSPDISYAGTVLSLDGSTYYWRIRFWDQLDLVGAWSSVAQFTMDGAPQAPSELTVDGMTNPIRINSEFPTFSAVHIDPNQDSAIYYEIDVNSNNTFSGTVMWATGKILMTSTASGTRSPEITYAGTALTGSSGTTYYWRIRFWDTDDKVSNWSTTATFNDAVEVFMMFEKVGMEGVKIN